MRVPVPFFIGNCTYSATVIYQVPPLIHLSMTPSFAISHTMNLSIEGINGDATEKCAPAKKLSVEQKLWLADQLIDKKQTAPELSKQYKLTGNFLYSLARRRRKGIEIRGTCGRPVGGKNKHPFIRVKKVVPRTVPVDTMPGLTEVPFPLIIEAVAAPTMPEPPSKRRRSTGSTAL